MKSLELDIEMEDPEATWPYYVKLRIHCNCGNRMKQEFPWDDKLMEFTCAKCGTKHVIDMPRQESNP